MATRDDLLRAHLESGLRAHSLGNLVSAREAYQQALILAPDHPDALNLLGTALLQLGQAEAAVDYLRRAVQKRRDDPAVLGNLAQAHFALGQYEESREIFRKASRLNPREMQFQLGIANSLAMQGKLPDAEMLLQKLTRRFPQAALAWFNYGNVLRDQGRTAEALESYRKAVELEPRLLDARNNLAGALQALQRFEEAEREYRACIGMAPDYVLARCNLASVMIDQGRFGEAERACREVTAMAPGMGQAHTFLGAALGHQGRMLEALECHRIAAELSPRDPKVNETYAASLTDTGYFAEGLRWFSRALALNPDSMSARQMLGSALLANGCLGDGWVEYGYRPARIRFREKYADLALSRTLPPELAGKHVCVLREQGLGDEIFFLRYVAQLHAAGAKVSCRASNKIGSLLARVACLGRILEETAPLPESDVVILVGDLPYALSAHPASPLAGAQADDTGSALPDFPRRISLFWPAVPPSLILTPLDGRMTEMRRLLAEAGSPPYLGVTWRGGIPPREQHGVAWTLYKEIGLEPLATALKNFPGTLIALQRNPQPGELEAFSAALGRRIHDFTAFNEDLEGMLALLALLDEYAGVSNTNVHLRAGVGRSARILVPCPADWRWMDAGRSSPWFPQFPIYRQSPQGDWTAALARLRHDLAPDS